MRDCLCSSTPTAERRNPITNSKNTSCLTTSDNNCNNNCSRCDILYSCTNFPDKSISHYTTATGEDCSCLNCVCSEMEIQNQTCDCVTCVCSVCFENGKKAPYTTYIPSTTCDCQNCVCSVCPSPAGQPKDRGDKGITAPRSGLQSIEQSKGQTYSFCKCLTCDVDGTELQSFNNPQLECNCNICKCSPCTHKVHTEHTQKVHTEHTQKVHTEHFVGQPMGHTSSFCKCLTCDVDGREPNFHNPQLECNCNICKCSPCTHKVHTEHTQKVHTEHFVGQSTGRTSSFCKCLTCDVDGTELQSFHNPQLECNCNICKCNPCTNPNKSFKTIASSNTRDLLTDQCKCLTCQDASMHKPDFFKTKVSCNCAKCECDPCADEDKRRQFETKQGEKIAVIGSNLPSTGIDYCSCTNTCTCLTCQDASMHKPDFFKTRVSCNCLECRCDPCISENKQRHISHQTREGENQLVCSNDDCHCDPCPDSTKASYKNQVEIVEQTKGEPCDCYICKCSMCKDPNVTQAKGDITRETQISKCHCTKCTCEPGDPAIHPTILEEDKTRNCNCVTCTCSPCDFPNSAQQALNCQCIVCQCSLCQLTNDQLPVSPLMPCNCTVCKCNPCGDPNKYRDQLDHEPHLAGCDCLTCTCNPCADPAVQKSIQPDQLIQETGHPQQFGAHEMKNCNCVQCCCKGFTAEQREKKVDATDNEVPCSCPICMCKKDKNTHGKGDEIYADEKKVESKYKSTPSSKCTCETCRCGDGTKKTTKTDVPIQITRSIHDRDCICKECLCEELQKTSTIEFVKCHCSTCNCVDCLFRQPEPQRKIQDRTITKTPTHCTCRDKMANECICKECKSFSDVSTELDDKATNSLCSCSACSCLTCHTKKVENIENMKCYCEKCKCEDCKFIKYQTRELNIKEELGDNKNLCTCSPCSCTDCVLNNKIEGKAIKNNNPSPILEAKCTCVEIPMSQPTRIEQQSEYVPNVPKIKQYHSYAAYHAFVDPTHVHKKLENLTSLPEPEKIKAAKGQKIEAENLYNYLPILLPQSAMPVRKQAKRKKNYKSSKSKKARGLTRSAELSRFKQFGLSSSKPIPYSEEVFPVSQSDVTNNRTIFHQLDPNLPEKPYDLTGNNKSFLKDKCKYEEQIKILKKTLNKIKGLKEKYAHNSHKRSVFKKSSEYKESISEISTAFKNLKKHCKADDKKIKELTEELKRYTSSTTFFNISTSVQQESEYDHTLTELSVDIQQQFPCYNPLRTSVPNIPVVQQETVKIRPATATLGQRRRGNTCDCALCTNAHPDIYSNTGYKISPRHSKLIRTINYDTFNKPNTLSHNLALTCKEDKRESEFPPYYILQPYCLTKENIPVECENHHATEMINAPDFVQPAAGLNETVNTWRNKCATDNANDIKMTKNVETQSFDRPKFNGVACKCGKYHKDNRFVNLTGFKVINVKRITVDSIVVEWKCPKSKAVTGYDIEINGKQKSKILSGWRTCAMIHSIDLSSVLYISIYAITPCGRCEPPAKAIYEIKQKSK